MTMNPCFKEIFDLFLLNIKIAIKLFPGDYRAYKKAQKKYSKLKKGDIVKISHKCKNSAFGWEGDWTSLHDKCVGHPMTIYCVNSYSIEIRGLISSQFYIVSVPFFILQKIHDNEPLPLDFLHQNRYSSYTI